MEISDRVFFRKAFNDFELRTSCEHPSLGGNWSSLVIWLYNMTLALKLKSMWSSRRTLENHKR